VRYSPEVIAQVILRYPLCITTEDKVNLAKELGIETVEKLYNLASRHGATGRGSAAKLARDAAQNPDLLDNREDFVEVKWTRKADKYLKERFGSKPIESIAFHVGHTETAVLYRARKLGLRLPVKIWKLEKVCAWLSMSPQEIKSVPDGPEFYPFSGLDQKLEFEVVTTSSLARWFARPGVRDDLRARGADEFFIREIMESVADLAAKKTRFERCRFLSHGHVCMNTRSFSSFGCYCTNTERQKAGEDRQCSDRILELEDLRPED
jgi:hypothetical protein